MNQREVQIDDVRLVVDPVVKGDVVCQIVEVPFLFLRRHDRAGHFPDIADTLLFLSSH